MPGHGLMAPRKLTAGPEGAVGSCKHRHSPLYPEAKGQVLRRPETPVSVDSAPTFSYASPQALTRLGSSVCMEASPYFPKSTLGVLRTSASCCVGVAPRPPITSLQVLRRPGLLTPWMRPSPSRSLNLCPERPGSSCQSGHGTTDS